MRQSLCSDPPRPSAPHPKSNDSDGVYQPLWTGVHADDVQCASVVDDDVGINLTT